MNGPLGKKPSAPRRLLAACLVLCALALSGCASRKAQAPPDIIPINDQNFAYEVLRQPGPTLVLYYNPEAWQSQEMYRRLDWLSKLYKGKVKFCAFSWDLAADPAPYHLEMVPTLVLFRDGWEIDRMRGIPADNEGLRQLNADLELWVMTAALQLTDDPRFQARYVYLYKNGNRLQAENDF